MTKNRRIVKKILSSGPLQTWSMRASSRSTGSMVDQVRLSNIWLMASRRDNWKSGNDIDHIITIRTIQWTCAQGTAVFLCFWGGHMHMSSEDKMQNHFSDILAHCSLSPRTRKMARMRKFNFRWRYFHIHTSLLNLIFETIQNSEILIIAS